MTHTKYLCKRCSEYYTSKFSDFIRHISRKYPCNKRQEFILLSDDQILVSSLMPYFDNKHTITTNDIEYLEKSTLISKNKDELFNELMNIERSRSKSCKYCCENYDTPLDLKKHVVLNCFYNELIMRKQKEEENKINNTPNISAIDSFNATTDSNNINMNDSTIMNDSSNNNINNSINNNINNNINLYFGLKPPIPFEENWENTSRLKFYKYL